MLISNYTKALFFFSSNLVLVLKQNKPISSFSQKSLQSPRSKLKVRPVGPTQIKMCSFHIYNLNHFRGYLFIYCFYKSLLVRIISRVNCNVKLPKLFIILQNSLRYKYNHSKTVSMLKEVFLLKGFIIHASSFDI